MEWLNSISATCKQDCDPKLFELVQASYNSPGRFYHTWDHILVCLQLFQSHQFDDPQSVFLALLFHDAIYVAGRKDNEQQSVRLAEDCLIKHSRISNEKLTKIKRLIMLSAEHQSAEPLNHDQKLMIDIDLSILGTPWPTYKAYAENVKREFCPAVTSEQLYRIGRKTFLKSLIARERIFLSDEFYQQAEHIARENIQKEIAMLSL